MRLEDLKYHYERYCYWVADHPNLVSGIESLSHWTSFIIAGRLSETSVVSEGIYSLSRLYSLFNDHAFASVKKISTHPYSHPGYALKVFLTILEYLEVTFEVVADNKLGVKKKWSIISTIQTLKTVARLVLLYETKIGLLPVPPVATLSRNALEQTEETSPGDYYTLKSGRMIRRVTEGPFIAEKFLSPLPRPSIELKFNDMQKLAEVIFILKPIAHLLALRKWGHKSYKPWLISLGMDLISLSIFRYHPSGKIDNSDQEGQMLNRYLCLLLYILRSPLYDRFSKGIIDEFFVSLKTVLPCFSWLINPLRIYLPKWQRMYFYMWSH